MRGYIVPGIIAICLGLAAPGAGQQHPAVERGFSADKVYHFASADLDQVNLFSGALTVQIPIGGSYPLGGGLTYGLTLSYSSKFWDFEEVNNQPGPASAIRSVPGRDANAGLGWMLSLGRIIPVSDPSNDTPYLQYLSPDGARHGLYDRLHPGHTPEAGVYYTRDSTYLRSKPAAGGKRTVEFPGGSIHTFKADGRIERIEDQHGNFLDVTYPDSLTWQLSDQHGRIHYVRFKEVAWGGVAGKLAVETVELKAFGGATATYAFEYDEDAAKVHTACTDTFHMPGTELNVAQLTKVILPDGSSYEMGYRFSQAADPCDDGELGSLTLPTLGRIEYGFGVWELPTEGCGLGDESFWAQRTPGVSFRKLIDASDNQVGIWYYNQDLQSPPSISPGGCSPDHDDPSQLSVTRVTTPRGDRSFHYFSVWPNQLPFPETSDGFRYAEYGLPINRLVSDEATPEPRFLSSETQDCDGAGSCTTVRSTYLRHDMETIYWEDVPPLDSNRRVVSTRTVFHDDNDRFADVTYSDFDGLGHYRTTTTGGDFPAGNVRTTRTTYNPGYGLPTAWLSDSPWILDTFTEQTVTEAGAAARSQTCFENGLATAVRTLKGASPGEDDVTVAYGYDSGNLVSERYYGGDVEAADTVDDLCDFDPDAGANVVQYEIDHAYDSGSLTSSQYQGATFLHVDVDIDAATGLVSASRDTAGLATAYEYDEMSRLIWERPATGHDAWTGYDYEAATATAPAQVKIRQRVNGSETGEIHTQREVWFDDFGRVWREWNQMPAGLWSLRETHYDAMGSKSRVSQPAFTNISNPTSPANWTEYLGYDPFGRPTTIRPPDGSDHDVKLVYTGDRVKRRKVKIGTSQNGETLQVTVERYDRQGRLYQVVENSGESGAAVTTTYAHDVGNRLQTVASNESGASVVRRTFAYDHRGFLSSESHPEKGGLVTYSDYDARGHAGRKIDGPNDLSFVYDFAERLTEINESGGDGRSLKVFAYAAANSGANLRRGKLETATRFQYDMEDVSGPRSVFIFSDGFEIGDTSAWGSTVGGAGGLGNVSRAAGDLYDAEVRETYRYEEKGGRVSRRDLFVGLTLNGTQTFTVGNFTQEWDYDDLGLVSRLQYPNCRSTFTNCYQDGSGTAAHAGKARAVSFSYDRGLLTQVSGYTKATTPIEYHASGLVSEIHHKNGVTMFHGEDPQGMARPLSIEARKDSTALWKTGTCDYDGAGNITGIGSSWFTYDPVSRLEAAHLNLNPTLANDPTDVHQSFTYDAFGNLNEIEGTVGRVIPTDKATNRLAGAVIYDAAGNLTDWNGQKYDYDPFNQIVRIHTGTKEWRHIYTVDGERVWSFQIGGPQRFERWTLRDLSGKVLRSYTAANDFWEIEKDYVYRDGQLLAAELPDDEQRHFHLDHLGTPRLITDGSGAQRAYHVYYPFGEEATNPFQDQEQMKFTGHERDLHDSNGTGDDIDYMHARYCSPLTGRFSSIDPSSESSRPSIPQSWNRYSYVRNSPLVLVDPDGELAFVPFVIGIAVGGVLFGSSAANAPESPDAELIPSQDAPVPLDVMAAEAAVGPAGRFLGGIFGRLFGRAGRIAAEGSSGLRVRTGIRAGADGGGSSRSLSRLGRPGTGRGVREVKGTVDDARKLFDNLRGGNPANEVKPGVFVAEASKGGHVTFRASSKSGPPTVDVHGLEAGVRKIKFLEKLQ